MTFSVRPARESDACALPALERSAARLFRLDPSLAWLADAPVPDAEQHRQAIRTARVWVAQRFDGQLSGFLRAVETDRQLHIEELSVGQDFQGLGIGRKLLSAAVEQARHEQLVAVTLTTFRDVPWNAPFYQRMGFELLSPEQTGPRLSEVLNNEIAHGLPGERRCAMALTLG
ncbi:GNAT family N-acetyltransferase [Pseudomonas sp. COR58]|uniref:GNAT family N-acetyltransferase n=1 Tax=Pseudomonas ekonensis TaxID=2842353 RepID=A0ABS6PED8_9PSED|nr:GNAT family N-acetyltransferase [Pseudomonas ekonensis]MBV4458372.1 GNAT family N-acetyltransferase [Pseudomonas ekonensis]